MVLNKNQKRVLITGIVVLWIVVLCPPLSFRITQSEGQQYNSFRGFSFISQANTRHENIHIGYLAAEMFLVCATTLVAGIILRSPRESN